MVGVPIPATDYDGIPDINDGYSAPQFLNNTRFSAVKGGYLVKGKKVYINAILKLNFNMDAGMTVGYDSFWRYLPETAEKSCYKLFAYFMKKTALSDYRYMRKCDGFALAYATGASIDNYDTMISIGSQEALAPSENELFFVHVRGSYDIA